MVALASSSTQRDSVHLSHPAIEHSLVIERALDIIYTCDFDFKVVQTDSNLVKLVIDFARKWEMPIITNIIRKELSRSKDDCRGTLLGHFLVALHLGDNELAVYFYDISSLLHRVTEAGSQELKGKRAMDDAKSSDLENEAFKALQQHYHNDHGRTGLPADHQLVASPAGQIYEFGTMPYREFLHIPSTVIWIILQAQWIGNAKGEDPDDYIQTLLNLACQ
jgi:hypothetical protein